MVTPTTPQGKAYKTIQAARKSLREQRTKTSESFAFNQKLGCEATEHLRNLYKGRGVKTIDTDPSFVYYRNLIERITHCHNRRHFDETFAKIVSEFRTQLGAKPSGDGAKFLGVLEGRLTEQLQKYFGQYQRDLKMEEELRKKEAEFLENFEDNRLPGYDIPPLPAPFEFSPEDAEMPRIPGRVSSLPAASAICGAPCVGHGREGKPCGVHLGSDCVCQYHGARTQSPSILAATV